MSRIGLGVGQSASICENQNYRLNGSHLISAQSFSLVEAAHSYMGGEAEVFFIVSISEQPKKEHSAGSLVSNTLLF